MNEFRNRLESDLAAVLGQPVYAVMESETGRRCRGALGFTSPHIAAVYREELEAAGRWQGLLPGFVICDQVIAEHHPDHVEEITIAAAVHESAHIVRDGFDVRESPMASRNREFRLILEDCRGGAMDTPNDFPDRGHDLDFIRAAMHIAYRLEARGYEIDFDWLWSPPDARLLEGSCFARAVIADGECERLRGVSIAEAIKQPAGFYVQSLFEICERMTQEGN